MALSDSGVRVLRRLVWLLLAVGLASLATLAHTQTYTEHRLGYDSGVHTPFDSGWTSDLAGACSAFTNYFATVVQPTCTFNGGPCTWAPDVTAGSCTAIRNGNTAYSPHTHQTRTLEAKCPIAGKDAGYYRQRFTYNPTGANLGDFYVCTKEGYTGTAANRGCIVRVSPDVAYQRGGSNIPNDYERAGFGVYTNADCDMTVNGAGSAPSTPQTGTTSSSVTPGTDTSVQTPCPPGTQYGLLNGTTVCVPYSRDNGVETRSTTSGTVTSTTTADGTTTGVTTATTSNTTCTGNSCNTTTNVTVSSTAGGSTTTSTTSSMSRDSFCAQNPRDKNCTGSDSAFGGSCNAGFVCDGDAALCAAAKGVWQQKCALIDGPVSSVERDLYGASAGATATGVVSTTTAISSGSFDQSNALGVAGACNLDKNITVWGTAVTLPFSQVCSSLAMLGNVLLAVGFLLALVIVGRG